MFFANANYYRFIYLRPISKFGARYFDTIPEGIQRSLRAADIFLRYYFWRRLVGGSTILFMSWIPWKRFTGGDNNYDFHHKNFEIILSAKNNACEIRFVW